MATRTIVRLADQNSGFLTNQSASTQYLTQSSASTSYLSQSSASTIYAPITPTTQTGFRNKVINGGFDIWQRGSTFTSPTGGTYTADRWRGGGSGATAGTFTFARTALGVTDLPLTEAGLTYYAKHTQTIAPSATHNIENRIENVRTFAGKTVTLSFYARLNSGTMALSFSIVQSLGTGGTGSPTTVTPTIKNSSGTTITTATSSWARYTATFTVPSLSGMTIGTAGDDYLSLSLDTPSSGTWNFDIAGIQLEEGLVATPFEQRSTGTELSLCQRYYQTSFSGSGITPGHNASGNGIIYHAASSGGISSNLYTNLRFPIMRTSPTINVWNGNDASALPATAALAGGLNTSASGIRIYTAGGVGYNSTNIGIDYIRNDSISMYAQSATIGGSAAGLLAFGYSLNAEL